MGKKRKQGDNNRSNQGSKQRQNKKQRRNNYHRNPYWIEDFRESHGDVSRAALTVLVTRVELIDDHAHHKKDHNKQANDSKEEETPDMDQTNATEEAPITAVESKEQEEETKMPAKPNESDDKQDDCDELASETAKELGGAPAVQEDDAATREENEMGNENPTAENPEHKLEEEAKASDTPVDAAEAAIVPGQEKETTRPNNNIFICFRRHSSAQKKKKKVSLGRVQIDGKL
jgi:hypothetical protein